MRTRLIVMIVAGFLIGAIAGAAVLALTGNGSGPAVATSGKALIGGPFTLIDQNGKTVTDQDFRGHFMLVFFGFTHCPDICPAELQVMSQSLEALGPQAEEVVPIFITLDPERDTQAVMDAYVKNFGSRFVGLTGSPEAVAAAAKAYRVAYAKFQEDPASSDYSVDHSALVYLMGRNGEYVTHFAYGTPADKMTETLRRYL
jgi:protein SCO1/2